MERLIDANEAKAFAAECWPKPEYRIGIDALLDNCPTIDPVHAAGVCYCRECRNYNKPRLGWCSHHMDRENPDDFCSWGKRQEDTK